MTWFDTHLHLTHFRFDSDRDGVIERAEEMGVKYILCCGWDLESSRASVELAARYPFIYAAVGIHPHDAGGFSQDSIAELADLARHEKVVAVGEIGLDFYRNYSSKEDQVAAFDSQIELARSLKKPMSVHLRRAHQKGLEMLKAHNYFNGVLHCFSGDPEVLEEAIGLGFYIGFAGPLTYSPQAQALLARIPLERVVLETDSPWLAPIRFRGLRNEPAYLVEVGGAVAGLRGLSVDEVSRLTTENGLECFGLG